MVEMFATNMSHKLPFNVASPGCKCSEHRGIKHLVGGSGLLGLLSHTTYSKKSLNTRCSGPLVAHDALALGSGESFNQTSITATSLVSETAIQSEILSESVALAPSCLAP